VTTDASVELDAEYRQLREEAGFVRRPGWTVLEVRGADAIDFLESQLTNDVAPLEPGDGRYAALLDRKGHLQSDMRVLLIDAERAWLVAEAAGAERVASHLGMYKVGRDVAVDLLAVTTLSVIGPASRVATGIELPPAEGSHRLVALGGVADVTAIATDRGFDLVTDRPSESTLGDALRAAGVPEVGDEAAEVVRVESGCPRLGREMGTDTMPAEAGLVERAVSFTKGCYIGQETVARLHYRGKPNRHLRGLRLESLASAGEAVRLGDRELGTIGTAALSPARGPIALAVLRREAEPGGRVAVGDEGNTGEVVELPFER